MQLKKERGEGEGDGGDGNGVMNYGSLWETCRFVF